MLTYATRLAVQMLTAAGEPSVGFEWDAPPPCPDAETVTTQVEQRLGHAVHHGARSNLDVIARVRRASDGRWDMRVWFITDDGTRRRDVADASCDLLAQTAATMVALKVQARADKQTPRSSPADNEQDASRDPVAKAPANIPLAKNPGPAVPREPDPPPKRRRRSGLGGDLRVNALVGFGVLPRFDAGPALAANLDIGSARVEIAGSFLFSPAVGVLGGGDVHFTASTAAVRAGWVRGFGAVDVAVTGGPEFAAVMGRGRGLATDRTGAGFWGGVVAGGAVTFRPFPRLGIWAGVDGFIAFARPRFSVAEVGDVHRAAPAGIRGVLGVSVRIGQPVTVSRRSGNKA